MSSVALSSIKTSLDHSVPHSVESSMELQNAIAGNRTADAIDILKNGDLANRPLPNGEMPLYYAIRKGSSDLVKELLDKGSFDTFIKDHQGLAAIDHAQIRNDQAIIQVVLAHGIGTRLDAARNKTISPSQVSLIETLRKDAATLLKGTSSFAPHQAAAKGNIELLKKCTLTELDATDDNGMTALHHAVLNGRMETAEFLMGLGCRLDLLTSDKKSALHLAVIGGSSAMIKMLLQKNQLDLNHVDNNGLRPLHYAMVEEDLLAAQTLIAGGDVPAIEGENLSPLDVLLHLSKSRSEARDPLNLTINQSRLFVCILLPWVTSYFANVPIIQLTGLCATILASWYPFFATFDSMQSMKAKVAYVALHLFSGLPGLNVIYQGLNTYTVGKQAIQGLSACWKNRFLEVYRPMRNAVVHTVNSLFVGSRFVEEAKWAYDVKIEAERMWGEWEKAKAENKDYDWEEFFHDYSRKYHSPKRESSCPNVDRKTFSSMPPKERILNEELNANCEEHAKIILGLKDGFTEKECKKAYRDMAKLFHSGAKVNQSEEAVNNAAFAKASEAAKTLHCKLNA